MRLLITGICGFVGSSIARCLLESTEGLKIRGIDNFTRKGSHTNIKTLTALGVEVYHGDTRVYSEHDWSKCDWVIDCAANPSVLAAEGGQGMRDLMDNNLVGTLNVLEHCQRHGAGLIYLSSSRVYSAWHLDRVRVRTLEDRFECAHEKGERCWPGISGAGISEDFPTTAPISPYGASKLASEIVATEWMDACRLPLWINRCGCIAGAGQFGTPDQGIFSYWVHSHSEMRHLKYTGFGGSGLQTRDFLHPFDLAALVKMQMSRRSTAIHPPMNVGGGGGLSLKQLTAWCEDRFVPMPIEPDPHIRPYDAPWIVMDNRRVRDEFLEWKPTWTPRMIFDEVAAFAEKNPNWLELCGVGR